MQNQKVIDELKDKYKGERCFIVATGASITKETLESIKDEISIGVSGIVYAKELWDFEPTFICSSDFLNFIHFYDKYIVANSPIISTDFIFWQGKYNSQVYNKKLLKLFSRVIFVPWKDPHIAPVDVKSIDDISFDLHEGIVLTGTVVQDLALPLAYWLGSNRVYLLGCDCDSRGHFYNPAPNHLRKEVIGYYQIYAEKFALDGRELINLSPSDIPGLRKAKLKNIL
ncbi:MAG TPA: DUF115 domain-containing protein [Candidatus Atribacteria bacterium]|nr:DUF115 domain-containing protein [Candidatus Atribacteria bacterium]